MNVNYTLGQVKNHADSATSIPANNLDPDAEWGPSRQDVRHRLQGQVNVPIFYGIRTSINVNAQSAAPYTITTGRDNNQDGVVNDRPTGVGRNTVRGASTWVMNLNLTKQFVLGGPRGGQGGGPGGFPGGGGFQGGPGGGGPGVAVPPGGAGGNQSVNFAQGRGGQGGGGNRGGRNGGGGDQQAPGRYSMELFIRADNVLNNVNYGSFSGNMLSQFFGQPTNAQQPRRLTVGSSFRF